jgi:hypothetical protein
MAQKHLDQARLLAIYRGDTGDFAAIEHLVSCPECQRAFDDTRWLLLLTRLEKLVQAGPHPDPDVLAGYRTHALSPSRTAEVERHLRACERCTAHYGRARIAEAQAQYVSPVPASVRRTLKRFRPRRLRRFGTVLVTGIDKGILRLIFAPMPGEIASMGVAQFDLMSTRELRSGPQPHPTSAAGRARRLARLTDDLVPAEEAIAETEATPAGIDAVLGAIDEAGESEPAIGSDAAHPLRIPAAGLELFLTPASDDGQLHLSVWLTSRDPKHASAGIRVRIRGPRNREYEVTTDARGRAALPFDPGATELVIEDDPPLALHIDFPE